MSPLASIPLHGPASLIALAGCCCTLGAALACAEAAPRDADRLSSLSTGQLRELCAEIDADWAALGGLAECGNGWAVYPDGAGLAACGTRTTACSATVGEWRACMRALFADPCAVPAQQPAECEALRGATGCDGIALPLQGACMPPTEQLAADAGGVYVVTSHSLNASGCGAEGTTVLPAEGHLAVLAVPSPDLPASPLQGSAALVVQRCDDIQSCQQWAAELSGRGEPFPWLYSGYNADAPNGFVCGPDDTGTLRDSVVIQIVGTECVRSTVEVSLRPEPGATLQLEAQTFELRVPAEGEPCFATVGADERGACISRDVLRAERVAPL